jgi:hypothetical protein
MGFLKKLAAGIGKTLLAICILFGLYVGYGLYADKSASAKAQALCSSLVPGSDVSSLRDRAIQDGAKLLGWHKMDGYESLLITYVGAPPFSRFICQVKAKDGRLVSAELSYLD